LQKIAPWKSGKSTDFCGVLAAAKALPTNVLTKIEQSRLGGVKIRIFNLVK
jgi:hypothetical protein